MAEVEWYVIIKQQTEGPFSVAQLLRNPEITPDTLAWKPGMKGWTPIREIPELKWIFSEEEEKKPPEEEEIPEKKKVLGEDALTLQRIEPPWIFWLLFALLICLYALLQFYKDS